MRDRIRWLSFTVIYPAHNMKCKKGAFGGHQGARWYESSSFHARTRPTAHHNNVHIWVTRYASARAHGRSVICETLNWSLNNAYGSLLLLPCDIYSNPNMERRTDFLEHNNETARDVFCHTSITKWAFQFLEFMHQVWPRNERYVAATNSDQAGSYTMCRLNLLRLRAFVSVDSENPLQCLPDLHTETYDVHQNKINAIFSRSIFPIHLMVQPRKLAASFLMCESQPLDCISLCTPIGFV